MNPNQKIDRIPVLITGFNRPDKLHKVFSHLSSFNFLDLYAACDGPRSDADLSKVEESRLVIHEFIKQPERIRILDENVGCQLAMSGAICWFFEQVEFGVINEDDVIIDITFFEALRYLLPAYSNSTDIYVINSYVNPAQNLENVFFLSNYICSWGWATWRDKWKCYEDELDHEAVHLNFLYNKLSNLPNALYFYLAFKLAKQEKMSSWAYRWVASIWLKRGYALTPRYSLCESIGISPDATHTSKEFHLAVKSVTLSADEIKASDDLGSLDLLRDNRIYSYVSRSTSLSKILRMGLSCMLPNSLFYKLRGMFR
jgi:hypothetical protein